MPPIVVDISPGEVLEQDVQAYGAWEDFLAWLAGEIEKARTTQALDEKRLREQMLASGGNVHDPANQQAQATAIAGLVVAGIPAWAVKGYVYSNRFANDLWDNSWKEGVYAGLAVLSVLTFIDDALALAAFGRALMQGGGRALVNYVKSFIARGCKLNSFAANTKVALASGAAVAISALTLGSPVLAYNESTQQEGGYTVAGTNVHTDQEVTFLSLRSEDGRTELVETTPSHPFYVLKQADESARPKPEGHEDLSQNWVGAGDLREGDVLKRADDRSGVVLRVATVRLNQPMYNLDVATADTFYVGEGQWLVHNQNQGRPPLTPLERSVLAEATRFVQPEILAKIERAAASGQVTTITINGRPIQIDPNNTYRYSGFTNFESGGFSIGPDAFKSPEELKKTIFHEPYRLKSSQAAGGVGGELAANETRNAASFADKAFDYLYGCGR